jgi:hypothetical protein
MLTSMAEDAGIVPADVFDPNEHWQGMPEFDNDNLKPVKQIVVNFANESDVERFARLVEQNVMMTTKSVWYPAKPRNNLTDIRFESDANDA